jgi:acyl-CoA synthetase (AMP-forming)/AMP-acid ligase II/thioesterase domain-containing protein/acyl carrier protein
MNVLAVPARDGPALLAPGRSELAWPAFLGLLRQARTCLGASGIRPGDAVALALPEGPEAVVVLLGVMHAAWAAPVNAALTGAEWREALTRLRARLVITLEGSAVAAVAEEVAAHLQIPLMALKWQPDAAGRVDWEMPCAGLPAATAEPVYTAEPGLLLFTSATTDRPKLVPLPLRKIEAMVAGMRTTLPEADAGRVLLITPLYHLQGILSVLHQTASGGTLIATPGFRGDAFGDWIKTFAPTQFTVNPTLCRALLDLCRKDAALRDACRSLRFLTCAGARLPEALRDEWSATIGVPLIEGYGLTEVGRVTMTPLDVRQHRAGSVGVCCGPETAIMDANGTLLPLGQEGEIVLRGETVFEGYAHDPAATAAAFRHGWFHTGDLGRMDADGFLYLTGRIKEMINRGGEKILPYEVEDALARHPAVAEAAVFGYPHARLGEDVAAGVVTREPVSAPALRGFLAERLAAYKLPRRILFLDAIPKGATGKPQRARLAELLGLAPTTPVEDRAAAPLDDVEAPLAAIWSRLLGLPTIHREDDFFLLGGDSLLAVELCLDVEQQWGYRLQESDLVTSATLADVARRIREAKTAAPQAAAVFAFRADGRGTPLFLLPYFVGNVFAYGPFFRHLQTARPLYVLRPCVREAEYATLEDVAALYLEPLRAARPTGPYLLGGYSLGGVFAFEMARRLIRAGEHVEGVVLLDSLPGVLPLATRSVYTLRKYARRPIGDVLGQFRTKVATGLSRLRQRALSPPGQPGWDQAALWRNWRPEPQPMRALLVWCASDPECVGRPAMAAKWRALVGQELQVCPVPGTHETVMTEPVVREVAAAVTRFLDATPETSH